jgi:Tfp pilus assembly protein PilF
VLLHATNAVLLGVLLTRLRLPPPIPLIAATIFALHPVHVESVAWITERKNTLSTLFYLLSALAYQRFDPAADAASRFRPLGWWAISLVLFACALLSKTVTASLPAALLLVIYWRRGQICRRDVLPLLSFFVLGLGMGLLTAWLETHHVGAGGSLFALSAVDRILLAGRVPWFYLRILVVPYPLIFFYPKWRLDGSDAWQYCFPLACVVLMGALWHWRRRIGRGPLVAALFFGGTLFPVLGFVNVFPFLFSYVADHFQYLASIGPITLVAAMLGRWITNSRAKPWPLAGVSGGLLLLATLSWQQSQMYHDLETLWRTTIARNPNAWLAHANLAPILSGRGEYEQAMAECQRATELHEPALEAHDMMAMLLLRAGRVNEAIVHMRRTVELQEELLQMGIKGNYVEARCALGTFLLQQNRPTEAAVYFEKALALDASATAARQGLEEARRCVKTAPK